MDDLPLSLSSMIGDAASVVDDGDIVVIVGDGDDDGEGWRWSNLRARWRAKKVAKW